MDLLSDASATVEAQLVVLRELVDTFQLHSVYSALCPLVVSRRMTANTFHRLIDTVAAQAMWKGGSSLLAAPLLHSPTDGKTFAHYPRQTELVWAAVQAASGYFVEVEVSMRGIGFVPEPFASPRLVRDTTYAFNFVGANPGRWRVWAVDASGRPSVPSAWGTFRYTQ